MKIIRIFLFIAIILTITLAKSLSKASEKNKGHMKKLSKSGLKNKHKKCPGGGPSPKAAWNNVAFPDANNFAYVNNDPYLLQHHAGMKNAKIWPGTLPTNLNYFPYTGVYDTASTGIHNRNYYDGSIHLSKVAQVACGFYSTQPRACVSKAGCGWCGQNNQCIEASPLGPIAPCARNTFLYNMPTKEWNPLKAKAINILALDNNGGSMLKVTHEPELKLAPVNKPYALD